MAPQSTSPTTIGANDNRPFDPNQMATIACMILLIVTVVACAVAGLDPDIGVFAFAFGAVLAFIDPVSGEAAVSRIDWTTVMLVGGIVIFVGVLQNMVRSTCSARPQAASAHPIVASLIVCTIGALVSAFASRTGILAAVVAGNGGGGSVTLVGTLVLASNL